jgi:hypothetical protein
MRGRSVDFQDFDFVRFFVAKIACAASYCCVDKFPCGNSSISLATQSDGRVDRIVEFETMRSQNVRTTNIFPQEFFFGFLSWNRETCIRID